MIRIILILLVMFSLQAKEIFIDYGLNEEGSELFKYYYDIQDEYFVEIGAYHPIHKSNTLNLRTQGWRGIQVDASYSRIAPFFLMRPGETSLNVAIGQPDTFVTLHDMKFPGTSTISDGVLKSMEERFQQNISTNIEVKPIKVPAISMKQLCERFYERKPVFLSIDIEGYDGQALKGNDWNTEKCRPEIIYTEVNRQTEKSGLAHPKDVLQANGYRLFGKRVGLNLVFVDKKVFSKYEAKVKRGKQLLQKMEIVEVETVSESLAKQIGVETKIFDDSLNLYDPKTDPIYYHFAKKSHPITLEGINNESNWMSEKKNRPIVVYHFDPHLSHLIVPSEEYEIEVIIAGIFRFWKIAFKASSGENLTAYVLNHQIQPLMDPRIVPLESSEKSKPEGSKTTTCLDNDAQIKKISKDVSILVATNNLTLSNNQELSKKQIIQSIQTAQNKLEKVINEKGQQRIENQRKRLETDESLQTLKAIVIAFMVFTSVCMGLCVICLIDLRKLQSNRMDQTVQHSGTLHQMDTQ